MAKTDLPVLAFPDLAAWEAWLSAQPEDAPGLWLKIAKQGCAEPSVTKAQAIQGALRHGWIDGQIDRFDEAWFLTRFTPRKKTSAWSAINRKAAEALIEQGRMSPRGLAEVERARADGRWAKAYPPQGKAEVPDDLRAALEATPAARRLFDELDATNRYAILYRTHQARSPEARARKIAGLVSMLARGDTIYPRKTRG